MRKFKEAIPVIIFFTALAMIAAGCWYGKYKYDVAVRRDALIEAQKYNP